MQKHVERDSKYLTKEPPGRIKDPVEEFYFLHDQVIEETELLVGRCFDPTEADMINYDAIQAICFLIIADQHIDLGKVELGNCLTLLGVHPVVLRDTVRVLKRKYHAPKNADLLNFIRFIGPILLEKNDLL